MKKSIFLLITFISIHSFSQSLTGNQLLEKAIQFHDPNNQWSSFNGTLYLKMESPKRPMRKSVIKINLPQEYFYVSAKRDTITTEYSVEKGNCSFTVNGKKELSEEEEKIFNVNCDRANLYKNYYTYLYGLPMKLKDKGTVIYEKVKTKKFKGKDYLVLKVTYDENVGKDTWYFYFNPKTYAMEVYQFFKDESKNDGEYILLTGLEEINGIKMPKNRAWYYNNNNGYLGTDYLSSKE